MMNTWLSSRNVLKIGCGITLLVLSFFIPSIAYAGELNAEEARVISAARGTFKYDGKQYRALETYINEAIGYLKQDDMDLTSGQADDVINEMYASIEEGVNSGYLYEIKTSTEEESGGDEVEDVPNQNNDATEDVPNQNNDVTEDAPNQTDEVSEDGSNETSDMADEQDGKGKDDASVEDDKSDGNHQSSSVSQDSTSTTVEDQVFRATGHYLGKLKYLGVWFSFILAGMLLATVLLKRNISRGEHDK